MHSGHRLRLKERFLREGNLDSFKPHEVLELLLFYCIPQKNTNPIGHALIEEFGSISNVFAASQNALHKVDGIGPHTSLLIMLIPHLAAFIEKDKFGEKPILNDIPSSGQYAIKLFSNEPYEAMYMICLDAQKAVIDCVKLFSGTLDRTSVHMRIIIEKALEFKAHSIILAHNHPGGVAIPSLQDIETTKSIAKALSVVEIDIVDHIIVAGNSYYSFYSNRILDRAPRFMHPDRSAAQTES